MSEAWLQIVSGWVVSDLGVVDNMCIYININDLDVQDQPPVTLHRSGAVLAHSHRCPDSTSGCPVTIAGSVVCVAR